jgi:hypothetical protein
LTPIVRGIGSFSKSTHADADETDAVRRACARGVVPIPYRKCQKCQIHQTASTWGCQIGVKSLPVDVKYTRRRGVKSVPRHLNTLRHTDREPIHDKQQPTNRIQPNMNTKPQDNGTTQSTEKKSFRDRLDDLEEPLDTAIDEMVRKIENGRVYDAENEKVRIKRKRALGYLVRTKLKIAEARELEELAERVEEIEQRQTEPQGARL